MAKQDQNNLQKIPDDLLSAIAETIVPVAPPTNKANELKARVMARVRGKQSFDLLTIKREESEWNTLIPGVEKKVLRQNGKGQVYSYLLKMDPGAVLPAHDHDVDEECFMLEGEVMIGEIHLSAGDYHFAPKGSKHGLITTKTGALAIILHTMTDY